MIGVNNMKKTIISIVTLTCILGLLSGCSSTNNDDRLSIETSTEETTENNTQKMDYKTEKNIYNKDDIKIEYPQILNDSNNEKIKTINDLIKEEAILVHYDTINHLEKNQTYEVDGEYDIKLNSKGILSIAYTSFNNITPSAHPYNMFYTTNINMNTGKEISLSDIVPNIDDNFIYNLKNGDYVGTIDPIYTTQLFKEVFSYYKDDKELINTLKTIPFYLTEENLGISLPVSHTFGDYANIEIPLEKIK